MADAKLTALSELSVPSLTDLLYTIDDPGGTPVSNKLTTTRALGLLGLIPGGRLTLTTAVPVTTANVTAAGTLYYTPYVHNVIRVWDGTRWLVKTFAEISLSLTLTSGKNYDVFVDDDAATLSLSAAWTNDTTRADALGTQDSVAVLNSDKTKLWLGTIRASGTNTAEDSKNKPWVVNAYNRVPRPLFAANSISHAYASTYREWNAGTGAVRLELLLPDKTYAVFLNYSVQGTVAAGGIMQTNIGVDTTTAGGTGFFSGNEIIFHLTTSQICTSSTNKAVDVDAVGIGYHYVTVIEQGQGGAGTWDIVYVEGVMAR